MLSKIVCTEQNLERCEERKGKEYVFKGHINLSKEASQQVKTERSSQDNMFKRERRLKEQAQKYIFKSLSTEALPTCP